MVSKTGDEKETTKALEVFREKWPHGKMSLLACHIFHAFDETRDWGGWLDTGDMDEGEKMFMELIVDLKKLVPERKAKVNIKVFEKDLVEEEIYDDDDELF